LGGVTATAPSRDLTDNKKKRREGSSRGESKRKLLKETQNQRKETRKKKKNQVEYRVEGAQDRRRRVLLSLRIKTQVLERLQCFSVVDGATHAQKNGVEGNGGSLEDGAEAFVLVLHGAQLVLWSSFLTVLDLHEVNVTGRSFVLKRLLARMFWLCAFNTY